MKHFHTIILAGFIIHFLPLSAEDVQTEEGLPSISSTLIAESEEDSFLSLDEELALLDEEFEEFKEEVAVAEEAPLLQAQSIPAFAEHAFLLAAPEEEQVAVQEAQIALEQQRELDEEQSIAAEEMELEPARVIHVVSHDLPLDKPLLISLTPSEATEPAYAPSLTSAVQEISIREEISPLKKEAIAVNLGQAFSASPVIYSLLLAMSVFSVFIWLYAVLSMRSSAHLPFSLLKNVQNKLNSNNFDEALSLCEENKGLFCKMISSGILSRRHGLSVMVEAMKAEGKRSSVALWQKIGLLNDVAIIAPMLGLLGTVLGMFYAFYDINRSIESVSTLFDGLGVSVGTTVAGLIVAILALILHSTAKYRLVRALAQVENEAQSIAVLIDDRTSIYKG